MTKQNQVVAVEKGVRADTERRLTNGYHLLQRPPLFAGISRTYRPKDEDGDQLPAESTLVQQRAEDILRDQAAALARLFDVVGTKEHTNTFAKADLVVGGVVLAEGLSVPFLLFLEKQLVGVKTDIGRLPVLDPSEEWAWDAASNAWRAEAGETTRTKKVPRNHVKAPPTDKHPAQVEMYFEDVVVGYWRTVRFSGAMPAARVAELRDRVEALLEAVKFAREAANDTVVEDVHVGKPIFDWLLAR